MAENAKRGPFLLFTSHAPEFDGTRTPPSGVPVTTLIVAQSSMSSAGSC